MVWRTLQASFVALSRYSWQLLIFAVNRLKDEAILKALKQYEATTGIRLELLCKPHGVGAKLAKRSEVCAALFSTWYTLGLSNFVTMGHQLKCNVQFWQVRKRSQIFYVWQCSSIFEERSLRLAKTDRYNPGNWKQPLENQYNMIIKKNGHGQQQ